jgi:4-hydroxysphinganine ceramide fatty acyl 2-hydroxylase
MDYYLANKSENTVVIYQGTVYNVKEYAPNHPGGDYYILDRLGKNIEHDFEEAEHTKSARNILADLPVVGTVESDGQSTSSQGSQKTETKKNVTALYGLKFDEKLNEKFNLDYTKGLMYQIFNAGFAYDEYIQYINEPKHLVNPVRDLLFFDSPILEPFSRAPWFMVPIAWIPLQIFFIYQMTQYNYYSNPLAIFAVFILGIFIWTLIEYTLHRFLFHGEDYWLKWMPWGKYLYTAHFLFHGIHHAFPQDRFRLVMPPIAAYALAAPIFLTSRRIIPECFLWNIALGFSTGYMVYDLMHYFMHHSNPESGYVRDMKVYHMQHHYKYGTVGFGVSNKFWDVVF